MIAVNAAYADLATRKLQLVVVDWDRFGNNKLLGFYEQRIADLDFRAPIVNQWNTLIDPDILESVSAFLYTLHAELRVGIYPYIQ